MLYCKDRGKLNVFNLRYAHAVASALTVSQHLGLGL